jgi:uncharacterized protein YciI
MKRVFAVILVEGERWEAGKGMEGQREWGAHATFMDGLVAEGFIVLGGPLEGTGERLHIVRADSEEEVRERLAADPWARMKLLRLSRVVPWTLRLGALP